MKDDERAVEEFLDHQAEGPRWKLRRRYEEDGCLCLWAVVEDLELDLFVVEFHDNEAQIHAGPHKWVSMSPAQLRKLAALTEKADEANETWLASRAGRKWLRDVHGTDRGQTVNIETRVETLSAEPTKQGA